MVKATAMIAEAGRVEEESVLDAHVHHRREAGEERQQDEEHEREERFAPAARGIDGRLELCCRAPPAVSACAMIRTPLPVLTGGHPNGLPGTAKLPRIRRLPDCRQLSSRARPRARQGPAPYVLEAPASPPSVRKPRHRPTCGPHARPSCAFCSRKPHAC